MKFSDPSAAIDLNYFTNNKQEINDSSDLIIEMIPIQDNIKLDCCLVTYCKITDEKNDRGSNYKVKVESLKLNVIIVIWK